MTVRAMVLWCPDWPVRALQQAGSIPGSPTGSTEQDVSVAVIEKGRVFACSARARRDGVRRGLRLREAQARCADLAVFRYDAVRDSRAFEAVLTVIEQLMPGVQSIRPGICAIRARGPSRYYGGERPAASALLGVLAEQGICDARVGIADGPFAAEHAARLAGTDPIGIVEPGGAARFLATLPVAALENPSLTTLLQKLGVRTLGDVAALDEVSLQDRFGMMGTRLHALASGRDTSTVVPRMPQRSLERSVTFEPGLDRVDQVTFGFRSAADAFVAGLTQAGLVCTSITVGLRAESGEASERQWLHPRWFTAADVLDRVRWQLQGAGSTETGLRSPVVEVIVIPESVDAIGNHESGLWGDGPDERIHHALSRVQSMLGHEAVLTAAVGGGRLLQDRQMLIPWGDRAPEDVVDTRGQPWPGSLPAALPATVFAPPRPVGVFTENGGPIEVTERGVITGEPALFSLRGSVDQARPITTWAGPWPIDERWWDAAQARVTHRFHVVDADGMAWLLLLEGRCWRAEARYD
ncbi:MAG: DNA polymerase Y family protein [Microbacteriaceae bacterium]|nr:MAG: DNA polymerase Y family protein [Microbacteriaceae bacterium]